MGCQELKWGIFRVFKFEFEKKEQKMQFIATACSKKTACLSSWHIHKFRKDRKDLNRKGVILKKNVNC